MILRNATRLISHSWDTLLDGTNSSLPSEFNSWSLSSNFQTRRKASPIFLFVAPWNRSTIPWTISPISLTKIEALSCRISVASVYFRMSQKPKIHMHYWPGRSGFTSSPLRIFSEISLEPASPRPMASSPPILNRVSRRTSVSRGVVFLGL